MTMGRSLALAVVTTAQLVLMVPSSNERSDSPPSTSKPFRHADHVRAGWRQEGGSEYARDCRGCHLYKSETETRDPQQVCDACHSSGGGAPALELDREDTSPSFLEDLDVLRADGRPFRHWSHAAYDCKRCHEGASGRPDDLGRRGDIKFRPGWHTCFECHDPEGANAIDADPSGTKNVEFVDGLNAYLGKATGPRPAAFRHDEHLPAGSGADAAACGTCHGDLLTDPGAAIGPSMVKLDSCADCHKDRSGEGLLGPEQLERAAHECVLLGTFPHGPHMDADALNKDPALRSKGCLACHEPAEEGRTYGLQSKFRERRYSACAECHDRLEDNPLAVRDAQGIDDHGKVESCAPCHAFGDGPMKTLRPQVEVSRTRPVGFAVTSHDHPMITRRGGKLVQGEDCRKCHRARIEGGLPSRISGKAFSHDTHLPPNPTNQDCVACHGDITGSTRPEDLSLYSDKACGECHKGGELSVIRSEETVAPRRVPTFPHDVHMTAKALRDPLLEDGCVSCHVPAQGGAPGVGTLPGAMDCSACHDHGERPEICADKGRDYVQSCARCHGPDGPEADVAVSDFRVRVTGVAGAQWHPYPAEQKCGTCHLPGAAVFNVREAVLVHADMKYERNGYHRGARQASRSDPEGCADCHWHELIEKGLTGSGKTRPEWRRIAEPLGDKLDGYPGRSR